MMYTLKAQKLSKRFGSRKVFTDIEFELRSGQSLAVVGPNGSGKSTLLRVLLMLWSATKGEVNYHCDGQPMDEPAIRSQTSFVAPYLNLYDHLTAEENLKFFATVAGDRITGKEVNHLLDRVGLEGRGADFVEGYSSGMKQRLKYAVALINEPGFLFLDEPTSNLDEDGKKIVTEVIEEYRKSCIIIIATNEQQEYALAEGICRLGG
ncbi:MAG: ABC transporter ATP-binding protein [Candidatus Zixiibacteriota bacterium]|nr:MAG: ABC transporter ATP-binding protein [candidate division Zixibacteria bacterium]